MDSSGIDKAGPPSQVPVTPVVNIPGYKIVEVLGKGGMAVVYLAIQESIGRQVALKILAPDHTDDTFTDRFLREARIISQLSHPNIITIFDAGVEQGYHYMCMEFVPGKNLTQARDNLTRKQKIGIVKQIALALEYAGKKGYVHRDIKPENIMLHDDGRAILTDFGIAHGRDITHGLTQTGKAIGTPYFMSPEQTKGLAVDHRSDIYSLGVVLFQALAGHVPFDGPSIVSIGIKHISEPIPSLPPGMEIFQPIINKCLSKEPSHRYQSASELFAALDNLTEAQLDFIEAKANALRQTSPRHRTNTLPEQASIEILVDSAAQPVPTHNQVPRMRAQRVSAPLDITDTAEFKRLARRQRLGLTILILIALMGAGFYYQDKLMTAWHEQAQPWLAKWLSTLTQMVSTPPSTSTPATSPAVTPTAPAATTTPATADTTNNPADTSPVASDKTPQDVMTEVQHYKEQLRRNPNDNAARSGIEEDRVWFREKLEMALVNKDVDSARQVFSAFQHSFPILASTQAASGIEQQIKQIEQFNAHLDKAHVYLAANAIAKPDGANALEEYLAASRFDANDPNVKQGLQDIANYFFDKAKAAQSDNKLSDAVQFVASGLSAQPKDPKLLALKHELDLGIQQQQQIASVLQDADGLMRQNQVLDPPSNNAYQLYRRVQRQDPHNPAALNGLQQVQLWIIGKTEALYAKQDYLAARDLLKRAQEYFPGSTTFLPLQTKVDKAIDATYPKITRIEFSATPMTSLTTHSTLEKLAPGQKLYGAFAYKNFYDPSTVLVAQLKDSSGTTVFDEKSVSVNGKSGEGYFDLQLPNPGSSNASYSVELYMKDVRILKANLAGLH